MSEFSFSNKSSLFENKKDLIAIFCEEYLLSISEVRSKTLIGCHMLSISEIRSKNTKLIVEIRYVLSPWLNTGYNNCANFIIVEFTHQKLLKK